MNGDLEILSRYMNDGTPPSEDLNGARRRLQEVIRSELANDARRPRQRSRGRRLGQRPRRATVAGGIAVFVAAVVGAAFLSSALGPDQSASAAAKLLRLIAGNAARQPALQVRAGQWLANEYQVSFLAEVSQVGSTPTPGAQATVNATIKEWANDDGESCTSATSGPAQFASVANQEAWHRAGLLDVPTGQPATNCTTVSGATGTNGLGVEAGGVINVGNLTTDPTTLARELSTGTTGITGLDQDFSNPFFRQNGRVVHQNAGFERAAVLLIGPTTGANPAFTSALYDALSMFAGVDKLGETKTHTGASGVGFSATGLLGQEVMVVDPSSGKLLEARNVESPIDFIGGLALTYLGPPPNFRTEGGGSYGVRIQWLDPIGSPTVVGSQSLPLGARIEPSLPTTGAIRATAKLGVTQAQLATLEIQLRTRYGEPATSDDRSSAHGAQLSWSFTRSKSQVERYARALRASGLFSSVVVR